jgi:hypothetical protein
MAAPAAPPRRDWLVLTAVTCWAIAAHVGSEWLFFLTKPSFLSSFGWRERLLLPGSAALPLLAAATALLLAAHGAARLGEGGLLGRACTAAAPALPAAVPAVTLLLLGDNFTYTLFGWGTISLEGAVRALAPILALALAAVLYRRIEGWERRLSHRPRGRRVLAGSAAAVALVAVASVALGTRGEAAAPAGGSDGAPVTPAEARLPSVLLFGSDGVNARDLSLYGSKRRTTPFLERLARESLVCDNAFPNASTTGGSTVSILSGRLPTETGVIYPPDIARGMAAHRHLPGLLRGLGYRTGQL